ncbi:MAG: S8 family serine peptidase, partial [Myxococcota bacterium]
MYRFVVPIAVVLGLIGLGSVESARIPFTEGALLQPAQGRKSVKWQRPLDLTTFEGDPASDEEHTYIVTFDADSVALYEGGVPGLDGTRASADGKLDPLAPASLAYAEYLRGLQNEMFERMESEAGHPEVVRTLQHALNGAVVRMSEKTAYKVSRMDGVRSVERDRAVEPTTATSIGFIGATDVHEGNATGGVPFLGEGTVVGIIDSGINLTSPAHPSFAEVAGDGYAHENPLGDGNYLGDCLDPTYFDETGESLCNNKLIGAYTFLDGQDDAVPGNPYAADPILFGPGSEEFPNGQIPSADTDGHGTHVASTAAGNIVFNAPLINADGEPSDVTFDQISGVAPRANIIAYKVCAPSCFFSDITAAVDQAIADGIVDVLNHSIGSPGGSPWATKIPAARAARNAWAWLDAQ